ncbi:hypothetical protein [Lacrimispora brassicae]
MQIREQGAGQKDLDQETTQGDKINPGTPTVLSARMELKTFPSDAVYVSDENELREAVKSDGTVVLENDIQLSETIIIDSKKVSITSENGKLSCGTNFPDDTMILVRNGAIITLSDIEIDVTKMGNPLHADWEYSALFVGQGSKLMIEDGISLSNDRQQSPGVNQRKYGIEISGNGEIKGGIIHDNSELAVLNKNGGAFILPTGSESQIVGKSKGLNNFRIMASSAKTACVIKNMQNAELNIQGGHINQKQIMRLRYLMT